MFVIFSSLLLFYIVAVRSELTQIEIDKYLFSVERFNSETACTNGNSNEYASISSIPSKAVYIIDRETKRGIGSSLFTESFTAFYDDVLKQTVIVYQESYSGITNKHTLEVGVCKEVSGELGFLGWMKVKDIDGADVETMFQGKQVELLYEYYNIGSCSYLASLNEMEDECTDVNSNSVKLDCSNGQVLNYYQGSSCY